MDEAGLIVGPRPAGRRKGRKYRKSFTAPSFPSCSGTRKATAVTEVLYHPHPTAGPSAGREGSYILGTGWSLPGTPRLGHQWAEGPLPTSERNQPNVGKT